jgi:hypothetical protein
MEKTFQLKQKPGFLIACFFERANKVVGEKNNKEKSVRIKQLGMSWECGKLLKNSCKL